MATTIICYDAPALKFQPTAQAGETNYAMLPFGRGDSIDGLLTKIISKAGTDKVRKLRFICHGAEGYLVLGDYKLDVSTATKFKTLRNVLDEQCTIELHACEVGKSAKTQGSVSYLFLRALADSSNASVLASDSSQKFESTDSGDANMEGTLYTFLPAR